MLCALSGQTPKEPVVSVKSGLLFEKSLVVKYVQVNGKCPVTDEDLTVEDLVDVKSSNKTTVPRPATATSIPQMLQLFQNEWDATMLETFTLKKHLDTARKELSQALYQHDAACRVIARLIKERDQAREALANAQAQVETQPMESEATPMEDSDGLPANVTKDMQATAKKLSKGRKKRQISRDLATVETIASYESQSAKQLHETPPGVTCIAVHPSDDNLIVTGGNDGTALIYNRATQKIAATLNGHTGRVNSVAFGSDAVVLTASADRTARVWSRPSKKGGFEETAKFTCHTDEVTAVSIHPSQNYAVTAARDGRWALHSVSGGDEPLAIAETGSPLSCASFHPDGLLLGTGDSRGLVSVYDVQTKARALTMDAHQGGLAAIAFNENGYLVASAGTGDSCVKLWDLRKQICVHTLRLESGYGVRSLKFDESGSYLAVAGADVRVFSGRTLNHVKTFTDHGSAVTGVVFGSDSKWLASSSMDRTVRFWTN